MNHGHELLATALCVCACMCVRVHTRSRNEKRRPLESDEGHSIFGPSRTAETFKDHILQVDVLGTESLRADRYLETTSNVFSFDPAALIFTLCIGVCCTLASASTWLVSRDAKDLAFATDADALTYILGNDQT